MIDVELYLKALDIEKTEEGAQELIFAEIIGCLKDCNIIWLPYGGKKLNETLKKLGYTTIYKSILNKEEKIDALYFGTPTIVSNSILFEGQFNGNWTKAIERKVSRLLCKRAIKHGCKCIVSGLGEGDISINERLSDIEKESKLSTKIVSFKQFDNFIDIVIEAR